MASKTISLDEEAYTRLKQEKQENESFSDVVKRLTRPIKKKSLLEFAGIWNLTEEDEIILKKTIKNLRSEFNDMFGH
jgi:predicted CopG family antitoxin